MNELGDVKVLFVAGFGPIVRETVASRQLYGEALGIRFKEETGGYLHTERLEGAKTFALWPLSQAAQSCFGKDSWPNEIPAPQAWLPVVLLVHVAKARGVSDQLVQDLEARRARLVA
jgi:hypothetical protein